MWKSVVLNAFDVQRFPNGVMGRGSTNEPINLHQPELEFGIILKKGVRKKGKEKPLTPPT